MSTRSAVGEAGEPPEYAGRPMAESSAAKAGGKKPGGSRRAPDEVRRLLLESARSLFAAKGYAGASTRDIATQAGVSEALLFRHFGTKAKLFERAILDPINDFIHQYVEQWRARTAADHTPEGISFAYVDGFYRLLSENRELVLALVTAQAYESIKELNEASPLSRLMDELEQVAGREAELRGFEFDVHISTRLVAGMVMSMALLDEWLFPSGKRRPSRQRIVNEMVAFMLHGLAHRNEAESAAEASG
jgi:AcrR family transcriptional regulator